MSKSIRHHKKYLKKKFSHKLKNSNRKLRSTRSRKLKKTKFIGGNGETVKCCMCEKIVVIKFTFMPRECLMKHGKASHRICEYCWWDPINGFALESASHECPGCIKGIPLTPFKKETTIFVDLTEN